MDKQKDHTIVTMINNKISSIKFKPIDKYNQTFYYFFLLGISTYVPWFFFMNAQTYWDFKLRNVTLDNLNIQQKNKTKLQDYYTSYMSISSAIPFSLFLIINVFLCKWISTKIRAIVTQLLVIILFMMTTIFVQTNTDNWQNEFLIITLSTLAGLNALGSTFAGTMFGVVGHFSSKYISSFSQGQAVSGIFAAVFQILSLWLSTGPIETGLMYFLIGDFIIICAFISYILLEKQEFFKYHMKKEDVIIKNSDKSVDDAPSSVSYVKILFKIWPYGLSMFLIFFVTYSIYPVINSQIESEAPHNTEWRDKYFLSVATFLMFSIGEYIGCLLSRYSSWLEGKPWLVLTLSIVRVIFVPIFFVCNATPLVGAVKYFPIYITNDFIYMGIMLLFSTSHGYLWSILFVLISKVVNPRDQEVASTMIGGYLGLGYSISSVISGIYFINYL